MTDESGDLMVDFILHGAKELMNTGARLPLSVLFEVDDDFIAIATLNSGKDEHDEFIYLAKMIAIAARPSRIAVASEVWLNMTDAAKTMRAGLKVRDLPGTCEAVIIFIQDRGSDPTIITPFSRSEDGVEFSEQIAPTGAGPGPLGVLIPPPEIARDYSAMAEARDYLRTRGIEVPHRSIN